MSKSEQCPLCKAETVTQDIEPVPAVCSNCGFVVKNCEQSTYPEQTTITTESPPSSKSSSDWNQAVNIRDSSEQNLVDILSTTENLAKTLLVSSEGKIRAGEIVTEAWERKILHGRSMNGGASAAVHIACRELGCPRPAQKIAYEAEIDTSKLYNIYWPLVNALSLDIEPPQPIEFVPFIFNSLGHDYNNMLETDKLLNNQKIEANGNPAGIAAAAVYIALERQDDKSKATYREISRIVEISKETIWKQATELRKPNTTR